MATANIAFGMERAVFELRAARGWAELRVTATMGIESASRGAILRALEAIDTKIDRLSGVLRDRVNTGALAPASWAQHAQELADEIDYQVQASVDAGALRVALSTLWQTAADVQAGVETVAAAAPFALGGLVLVLVLVIIATRWT